MKFIKLALISLVFLFIVATAISLLIPAHIRISKAVNLAAPKDSIFHWTGDTSEWSRWHPAFMPTGHQRKFEAITVSRLPAADSNERLLQLQQKGRQVVVNGFRIHEYPSSDSVTLQWYMDFHIKWYPWQKFGSMFYENTYGVMMEQGLQNLRKLAE